jgi:hypothetical protein
VKLRCEAHLDVADAVGLAVLGQLARRPLERLWILQHGDRVPESLEVLGQAGVARAEDQRFESFRRLRGKGHLAGAGHVDHRAEPQRAVEVDVEVGLGQAADEFAVHQGPLSLGVYRIREPGSGLARTRAVEARGHQAHPIEWSENGER